MIAGGFISVAISCRSCYILTGLVVAKMEENNQMQLAWTSGMVFFVFISVCMSVCLSVSDA